MDKTGMRAPFFKNGLDAGFFAKLFDHAEELNLGALLSGETFGILLDLLSKVLGKPGII